MILLSSVSFFKCCADKFCTFASFNAFKLLFTSLTTDFSYFFFTRSSCKEGSLSLGCLAAISDLPLAEYVSDTRYTVLTTQTNTFRKTFTKFAHVKILMFHKNVHYKDIRSGSSSEMSQQLPSVSWWRCMRAQLQLSGIWELSNQWGVGIYRAVQADVVLAQTVVALRDSFCPARECLIIEARVSYGPIKVLPCQGLLPELVIISNPCCSLVILCYP